MQAVTKWDISDAKAFADAMYPFVYVAYSEHGAYDHSSQICCELADILVGGLRKKTVLDLGCGFGTTTRSIAMFAPGQIIATDRSSPMTDLMRHIYYGEDPDLLKSGELQAALGDDYDYVVRHIRRCREEFAHGVFRRRNGKLSIETIASFDLSRDNIGAVDAAVASHSFHWPISELRNQVLVESETVRDRMNAVTTALIPVARVVKAGGAFVFATMENFVENDKEPACETDIMTYRLLNHPVLSRFEEVVHRLLKERHGHEKVAIVARPRIIQLSWMDEACQRAGFKLRHVQYQENPFGTDALRSAVTGTPMLLGAFNLNWEEVQKIMRLAHDEVVDQITEEERFLIPMREHQYIFALEKM